MGCSRESGINGTCPAYRAEFNATDQAVKARGGFPSTQGTKGRSFPERAASLGL